MKNQQIKYIGEPLSKEDLIAIKNMVRGSNHPLSRRLYLLLPEATIEKPSFFNEVAGKGIEGVFKNLNIKVGSANWVHASVIGNTHQTRVFISIDDQVKGYYVFENEYRKELKEITDLLKLRKYQLYVLSGDNNGEQAALKRILPSDTEMLFNQKPEDKLQFIKNLQDQGKNVLMIGDGLNDAGALAQSNVGISISENVNVFTPASDAILDAAVFNKLPYFLKFSKNAMKIIKMSYCLAILYNIVGISFALTNNLSPLVAAIIMPLSTATIISFVSIMSNFYALKTK